jgi:rod shape determining protein RodA
MRTFLDPEADPLGAGFQLRQSLIAIGTGGIAGRAHDGLLGTGLGTSLQKLFFLPEPHTDFVFAVVGERFGFLGAAFVLSLYALLLWRTLRIASLSKNLFGTLIAGGLAAMLLFQILVNVGMNLGIMPVTGITLPLMSYGGSSVLVTFLAIGLLQSIHVQALLTSRDSRAPTPLLR